MYTIYKITSPSGRCYVGMTKLKLSDRWDAHCTRAFHAGRKHHPFCCAIRKYGKAAFIKEVLETVEDLEEAKAAEVRHIAVHRSAERQYGYNLSPGGDYDSETGKIAMRKKMLDPEFNARYRANLSAGIRAARKPESYDVIVAAAKQWRADNPIQSYKNGRRAVRIATAAQNRPWTGVPGEGKRMRGTFGRLWIPGAAVLKARRAYFTRKRARLLWAERTEEEKIAVFDKIAAAHRATYAADPVKKAKNFEQIKAARAGVDRKKQAAAASAGQKAWWVELRKDPVRYAEYIERRKQTFRANLRHRKRGAEEPLPDER